MEDLEKQLWNPPLQIMNLRGGNDNSILFRSTLASINTCTGNISVNATMRFLVDCPLNFQHYPFDIQFCPLVLMVVDYGGRL